jgi:hypothetical protein
MAGATVAAVVVGLTLAGGAGVPRAVSSPEAVTATEVIRQDLGSKRTVGYFVGQNGNCRVTLVIAERDSSTTSPMRVTMSLEPGQRAGLASAEGEQMSLACGPAAKSLQVERGAPPPS